jgi:hypothetical protein
MLAVAGILVASAVLSAPAYAAKPSPTELRLQAEVTALTKKVNAQQKTITTLQKNVTTLNNAVGATIDYALCSTAVTADAFQQTWAVVNLSSTGAIFGAAEAPATDPGSCKSWKITRAATGTPPNLTVFKALLALFS